MYNRAALRNETASLAAQAATIGCAIAVVSFYKVWESPEEELQALEYQRDQVRAAMTLKEDKKQRWQWDVGLVAAELGLADVYVEEMFRTRLVPVVKMLALEAAYGDRKESDDARRQLGLNTSSTTDKEKDNEDQGEDPAANFTLVQTKGWRVLTLLPIPAPAAPTGGKSGRRARMLREMQASAVIAPGPRFVIVPLAPAVDFGI